MKGYAKSLRERNAALFVGAGMSMPSGYSSWKGLLADVASELGLSVDRETDLIALAQYHVNARRGKGHLNQLLIDEFTKGAQLTENHRLIAHLPLNTVWTTNYDTLIERAFEETGKRVDVKHATEQLAHTKPGRNVTVYKMHGDISRPDEAVLTKDDYESYSTKRTLFSEALRGDLVNKTFLFVGFSFTDPNIDYVLSRVRTLVGLNRREHYCIVKTPTVPSRMRGSGKAEYEYESRLLSHRIDDLKRFGIQTVLIDDYSEIENVLTELNRRSHSLDAFVSGSAHEFKIMPQKKVEEIAHQLGKSLIENGFNLVSGFGLSVGSSVTMGAIEAVYTSENSLEERVLLRPFPQNITDATKRSALYTQYRRDMISKSGHCIIITGNRVNPSTKEVEIAPGVLEEYAIAKELGKTIIPIGATGYAARAIWHEMHSDLRSHFPKLDDARLFDILNNPNSEPGEIVYAVIQLIKSTQ